MPTVKSLAALIGLLLRHSSGEPAKAPEEPQVCFVCDEELTGSESYRTWRVCPACGFHYNISAHDRLLLLADKGTFKERNKYLRVADPLSFKEAVPYQERLAQTRKQTGMTEAVITGTCRIEGVQTAILALDFRFLGGSMGIVVGEKIAQLFDDARRKRLPTVALVTSGGARMQEGVFSLMQMAKTVTAAKGLHEAGLPLITVMANPTTGQVYASFANMADIVLAEPGALIGFASLRTARQASHEEIPASAHTAETHLLHGTLDRVVPREQQRQTLASLLRLLASRPHPLRRGVREHLSARPAREDTPGRTLELARHRGRPTARDYIRNLFTSFEEFHGDRVSGDDSVIVAGIGYLANKAVAVIATQRERRLDGSPLADGRLTPSGIRKAQRAMRLAAKFHLPLVTLIDTPGVDPSLESEERGLGGAIAETLALLVSLPVPVMAVIVGEGGSEGALALSLADRVLMQEHAIYSPISPEGAAALLYRDPGRAEDVASSLKVGAWDCAELGIIDQIIPEPPGGAHIHPEEAASLVQQYLLQHLWEIQSVRVTRLVRTRRRKFRRMGDRGSFIRSSPNLGDRLEQGVSRIRQRLPQRKGPSEEPMGSEEKKASP